MEYAMEERVKYIIDACLKTEGTNPMAIFNKVALGEPVRMHGPEHHILDGACVLTAFRNAGGNIDLKSALERLAEEGLRMPGAACGLWGVCGAVTSIGAALAIIDGTGPLSVDDSWGSHMQFTSVALKKLSEIGGPRCCKRDAIVSMQTAVEYINARYEVKLESENFRCGFSNRNEQCLKERCPFYCGNGSK